MPANVQGQYFWIQTSKKGKEALEVEGILRIKDFSPNEEKQLFRFEPVNNNINVNKSFVIVNELSGKALDIPNSSFSKGEKLVQWTVSKGFNQRWTFQDHLGQGFLIKSLLTGMVMDIADRSKKPGTRVLQWEQNGGSNQLWIP